MTDTPPAAHDIELSICIATYNRGDYITATLESIIPQLEQGVEIIVVDGGSSDGTEQRIAPFVSRCPALRYYRETTNSGVDADFDKAVGYAAGRYVWLMADDDLLFPDAVGRVMNALAGGDELIVVNAEVDNADLSVVLNPRMLDFAHDTRYRDDPEAIFAATAQGLSFIGCTIIRRELWLERERGAYYGSLFIHVGVVFQSPPLSRASVLADPVVRIRYGNAMWTPRSFEIWMFKWPRLIWSFVDFSDASKARVTPREPWRQPQKLFHYRSKKAFTREQYVQYFKGRDGVFRRGLAYCICRFPPDLANILSLAYLALKGNRNLTPTYDLVNSQSIAPLRRWLTRHYGF